MTHRTFRNTLAGLATVTVLALLLLLCWPAHGSTSQLTGTLKDSFGNGISGTLYLNLPVPATDTSTGVSITPTPISCRLINGTVSNCPPVFDVANLQPQNLYYIARAYDLSGTLVFNGNYPITGSSYNIFSAVPTTVTTSNVSYINPATVSSPNTFCCTQTFQGQINSTVATGTPPFSIASTTLVPNLNVQDLNGCIVSGTPAANQVLQASSPTACGWQSVSLSGFKLECVNTTSVTVANTVSLLPLQGCTIPANDIGANQTFYIDAYGLIGDTAAPTCSVGVYLDGTLIGGLGLSLATANNQPWALRGFFTGLTTGTSGTVTGAPFQWMSSPSGGGGTGGGGGNSAGTVNTLGVGTPPVNVTINTTVSHTLQLQVQWGTANSLNTISSATFSVHRVG